MNECRIHLRLASRSSCVRCVPVWVETHDDCTVVLGGQPLMNAALRGECGSFVLALKVAPTTPALQITDAGLESSQVLLHLAQTAPVGAGRRDDDEVASASMPHAHVMVSAAHLERGMPREQLAHVLVMNEAFRHCLSDTSK